MMKVGRETPERTSKMDQKAFFMRQETNQQIESPTFEKKWEVEQIDVENQGRENPFKRKETKYENIK